MQRVRPPRVDMNIFLFQSTSLKPDPLKEYSRHEE